MVNCTSRSFSGSDGLAGNGLGRAGERLQILRDELVLPAVVVDRQRPGIPVREVLGALCGFGEVHRGQARPIRAVGELVALRWLQRADPLLPVRIVQLVTAVARGRRRSCTAAPLCGSGCRSASPAAGCRRACRSPACPPVPCTSAARSPCGDGGDTSTGRWACSSARRSVGVAHARRNGQQHVVGVTRRADVQSVGVQVQRRRRAAPADRCGTSSPAGICAGSLKSSIVRPCKSLS